MTNTYRDRINDTNKNTGSEALKPIAPDKVALLQKILDGIEIGDIECDMQTYHCETSHCLAGWIEVEALTKLGYNAEFDNFGDYLGDDGDYDPNKDVNRSPLVAPYIGQKAPVWEFAENYIGLSRDEAVLLFDQYAYLAIQREMVRLLGLGYRFSLKNGRQVCCYYIPSDLGENGSRIELQIRELQDDGKSVYYYANPDNLVDYCILSRSEALQSKC